MAEREIQLVVNYGAAGNTDVSARAFARGLERQLGKPVAVVNRPGVECTIGPAFVATQRPDGYTMGVATYSTVAIQPHVRDLPYTIDSFDFIAGYRRFRYGAEMDERVCDSLARFVEGNWLHSWPSATRVKVREAGRIVSMAVPERTASRLEPFPDSGPRIASSSVRFRPRTAGRHATAARCARPPRSRRTAAYR